MPADAPTTFRWNLNRDSGAGWSTHVTHMHPGYLSSISSCDGGRLEAGGLYPLLRRQAEA